MSWRTRFRRRVGLLENLWALPVMGAVLGAILGLVVSVADEHLEAPPLCCRERCGAGGCARRRT